MVSFIKKSRLASILILLIGYTVAIWGGWELYIFFKESYSLLIALLIADVAATSIIFIFSLLTLNSSFYDPYWSLLPPLIALAFFTETGISGNETRMIVVFVLVVLWGARLTLNFLRGWPGFSHEDWRYRRLKGNNPRTYWLVSFSGIHVFPTILVFAGCLPLYIVSKGQDPLGLLDLIATVITFTAILIEFIADEQLKKFKKTASKGEFMNKGLWAYSRHPNYFGEVMFWTGLYLFSLSSAPFAWWVLAGPLAMWALFVFISIPMMEKRILEKYPRYKTVIKSTSSLILLPPKKITSQDGKEE